MRAARTDGNQQAIVDHLRAIGWSVFVTSAIGRGFPDFIAARGRFTALGEIKDPSKPKRGQRLTPDQERFHADWQGVVLTVYSPADAETKLNAAAERK
jgi:hypothetical protein